MKIIFGEERLRLYTEGLLEELHLERFSLKHEGDITTCMISYKGPYTLLEKPKRAERKAKDSVGLYEWPEEEDRVEEE